MQYFERLDYLLAWLTFFWSLGEGIIKQLFYLRGAICQSQNRLDGKTVIITGGNCGIGKFTVQNMYERGAKVILACRDLKKGEQAKNEIYANCKRGSNTASVAVKLLDLSSLRSIRSFSEEILLNEEKVHILVNNAGLITWNAETSDGFEMVFGVNYLGHFYLTLLLLPKLIESEGKIINVTSITHWYAKIKLNEIAYKKYFKHAFTAYSNSKLALILFTKELARRLEGKNVNVYAVHPGVVRTSIGRTVVLRIIDWLYKNVYILFLKTEKEGAQTIIYCAVDDKAAKESGLYYDECKPDRCSEAASDSELARQLWDFSLELLQEREKSFSSDKVILKRKITFPESNLTRRSSAVSSY